MKQNDNFVNPTIYISIIALLILYSSCQTNINLNYNIFKNVTSLKVKHFCKIIMVHLVNSMRPRNRCLFFNFYKLQWALSTCIYAILIKL